MKGTGSIRRLICSFLAPKIGAPVIYSMEIQSHYVGIIPINYFYIPSCTLLSHPVKKRTFNYFSSLKSIIFQFQVFLN